MKHLKYLSLLVAFCMVLTACGGKTPGSESATETAASSATETAASSVAESAAAKTAEPKDAQASSAGPLTASSVDEGSAMESVVEPTAVQQTSEMGELAYQYLQYIDQNLPDRDCLIGSDHAAAQTWLVDTLQSAGYTDVQRQDFSFTTFNFDDAVAETGTAAGNATSQNIVAFKKGTSGKQIIIGAHYDGTGAGDNGSGTALALAAACLLAKTETYYDLTFVFFGAEEYGCYGSAAYVAAMSEADVARTQYMINMDSLAYGDYCYLYGGVADLATKTVRQTDAFDNAMATARSLGLKLRANPWTFEDPEPTAVSGVPAYPAPSTGDWSDHVDFYRRGIEYVYFEATNWEIGDYDGYEETEQYGTLMNTGNDTLAQINGHFPGRAEEHLNTFAILLEELLLQGELDWTSGPAMADAETPDGTALVPTTEPATGTVPMSPAVPESPAQQAETPAADAGVAPLEPAAATAAAQP